MSTEPSDLVTDVRAVLETFLSRLDEKLSAQDLERVLRGDGDDLTSAELGNKPEAFTEDNLTKPLLAAVGLDTDPQPYGKSGERDQWPDFEVTNLNTHVIGESKPLNNVGAARPEIKEYLDRKSLGADYGIATDGIEWSVYKIELGGDFTAYPEVGTVDLREALTAVASEQKSVGSTDQTEVDIEAELEAFVELFEREAFERLLSQRAPRELRDARKRDVEEFYELYIELLFGASDEYDYDTNLLADIQSPYGTTEHDERLFAITLMNRLLFVKFLEKHVLDEGFLEQRVVYYEENADEFAGNLYETQIAPLFYKLFNTPKSERAPKYRNGDRWFSDVPYLNGGLFREAIPNERQYTVNDRVLPQVIRDLIEGSRLELNGRSFDPAILGSVFEKTINHIEQERTQKDIGAYYTPNDVTELVIEQSVDPKIRDVLVEAVVEENATTDAERETIRSNVEELDLPEILRRIEEGEGWFGNADAIRQALQELRSLKVIDPACGSGHFLTSAMDEIHRAQVSLLRGSNFGKNPDPEERYREKQRLALNCIYGVDVDPIAAEIAKLRVWLKIVEGNGWDESFGKLPNIDVNITDGNSLVGLPMTGSFDDVDVWSEDIQEIERRRQGYKQDDEGDPREMERFLEEEIRPELNREYLEMYSKPVETAITDVEEFDAVCEAFDDGNLYPTIQMVRVEREDGEAFDADGEAGPGPEEEMLSELGFSVYTKSATVDVRERESRLKADDDVDDHRERLEGEFRELLEGPYVFSEVQRQPLAYDLDRVLGTPFHWMAEFPEVATENGGRHEIDFDIILGNPPYGDLLSDEEKTFVSTYSTGSVNDISANFVERQVQLLDDDGYFGNVTTLRLIYQSSLGEFHELLRNNLDPALVACFGSRPSKIFENADVRVAIITGQRADNGNGEIRTSDFILFTEENRQHRLDEITYEPVDGLVLRDAIGGDGNNGPLLPKIGTATKRRILVKLRDGSDGRFRNRYTRDDPGGESYPVWRREGVRYWINPMLEELYSAREVQPIYFESELDQKTAFLVLNSSLYFVYWMTYGNQHHHNWAQLGGFPWPSEEAIAENEDVIGRLADELWRRMSQTFEDTHESHGEFSMGKLRPIIDDVDVLVGELYGLSREQIDYTQAYLTDLGVESGRAGTGDRGLAYEPLFVED